jgi:hypothetical protein
MRPGEAAEHHTCDVTPKNRALQIGVVEVEPDQNARLFDVFYDLVKLFEAARRPCRLAVEGQEDVIGAEECDKRLTTALLWHACADGYSGKFGVARNGRHVASGAVAGFASASARGIAAAGRQNM